MAAQVAGSVVAYEVRRQSAKDAAKERAKEERRLSKEEGRERIRAENTQRITCLEQQLDELFGRVQLIEEERAASQRRSAWFRL